MTDTTEIPTYRELMLPTLRALDALGGQGGNDDIDVEVVEQAGLTPEQMAVEFAAHQAQDGSKVGHRLAWARTYLKKAELIDNPTRASWVLLDDGRGVLELPKDEAVELLVSLDRQSRRSDDHEVRRAADPSREVVYETVQRWRDVSLTDGRSLFDPSLQAWTADAADELSRRFIEGADEGPRSFFEKLRDQLSGADQPTHLLMAELLYLHILPLTNVSGAKKLENLDQVGEWAPNPFEVPAELREPPALGIFNGGAGFNTNRPSHLRFLIRMVQRWTRLGSDQRAPLLADPWLFKDFLSEVPLDGARSQRNAMLLMLFPDTFEDIVASSHKERIAAAFPGLAGESSDIDRQILAIRRAKTDEFGADFSWYQSKIRPLWDKGTASPARPSAPDTVEAALETLLPNEPDRIAFATLMATAIIASNEVNPTSWSVSFRSGGIHLNVGPNRTLSIRPSDVGVAIRGDSAADVAAALVSAKIDSDETKEYSFPGGVYYATLPASQAPELVSGMAERVIDAAKLSAPRSTPYWTAHSVEAVEVLRELSALEVPDLPDRPGAHQGNQRAWIIHVKRDGKSEAAEAAGHGETRVFWQIDVPPNSPLDVIKDTLREADPEASNRAIGNQAGSIHRFITKVQQGDAVVMPHGSDIYLGTVVGDAVYREGEWVRSVDWLDDPVDRSEVSPALYSRLRSLLTITDITPLLPEIIGYLAPPDGPKRAAPTGSAVAQLPPIDDDLARDWMLDRDWLVEIANLLQRKRQLIFHGPPGTGKTYLAERLAQHLTSDGGTYKLVQFHPSYSYEDFVEGFRPRVDPAGNLTYELTPGPLRLLAEAARESPGDPYLLIIDEINRGNLAKIFGELYYLLEYREQSLVLQYGSTDEDEFSLPENLFVIGTMNTADRSIALVDSAIRRRFNFVEFSPLRPPIDGLLSAWLRKNAPDSDAAALLTELNRRLDDPDFAIGPSYLMNDDVKTQAGLERIWKFGIMPLLVEHFYGQAGATDRFELAELRRAVRPEADAALTDLVTPVDEDDDASDRPD